MVYGIFILNAMSIKVIKTLMKTELKNGGYTLIEVMAVTAIIMIMSAVLLADYASGQQNLVLKQSVAQIVADLRMAQNMAMNTTKFGTGPGAQIPIGGYGVNFVEDDSAAGSYTIFADLDGQNDYDSPGETFAARTLDSHVRIATATAVTNVTFIPPDPKVCFDAESSVSEPFCYSDSLTSSEKTITLRYGTSTATKVITINGVTGQITAN